MAKKASSRKPAPARGVGERPMKTYRVLGEAPIQINRVDYFKGETFAHNYPQHQEDQLVSQGIIEVVREKATASEQKSRVTREKKRKEEDIAANEAAKESGE